MSTIRKGPVSKPQSVYTGQQQPNATAETLSSLEERVIRSPLKVLGWSEIGEDPYGGDQAYAGLYVQATGLDDGESAGRVGVFDADEASIVGRTGLFVTLHPGYSAMRPASVADGSVIFLGGINLDSTTPARVALPGSFVRNDAMFGFTPGRDVYADWETDGLLRQDDPPVGVSRFKVGQAVAGSILYLDPDSHYSADLDDFGSSLAYVLSDGTETIKSIYLHTTVDSTYAILIGTDKGRILRSLDNGRTFGVALNLGTGYTVTDFCVFGSYLYASVSHASGFQLVRSSDDGASFSSSHTNATGDTDGMSLVVFGSYLVIGSHGSGYVKIWTTTDGASLTARYTSPTESTFCRLSTDGSWVYALIGGTTARHVASVNGVNWAIYNTYTGYSEALDLISYGGTNYALVSDGSHNAMIYSGSSYSIATSEFNPVGDPNGFLVVGGVLYLCGGNLPGSDAGFGLYKRTGGATWNLVASARGTGYCRRYVSMPNGYTYFVGGPLINGVYKIPSLQALAS